MRLSARASLLAAASIPVALAVPGVASAAEVTDVTYAFTVGGSTVNNTITNNTDVVLTCTTSLAPAPGGVLPPVGEVIGSGQSLFAQGAVQPGETIQSVTDVPDGTYVALASCGRDGEDPAMWVSAYPGIEEYLVPFGIPAFTVEQASSIVTVPGQPSVGGLPDLGAIFAS